MNHFLNVAVEDIENLVNDFNSNNEDVKIDYERGPSTSLLEVERLQTAHDAFLKLEETTSKMDSENVSLETQDLIKQHLLLIQATTGFTVSISQEDGGKGFVASIWEGIKKFFAAIWRFITSIFSKDKLKAVEEKTQSLKEKIDELKNDLNGGKIKNVSIHIPKCNFPAIKLIEHKNFYAITSEFNKRLLEVSTMVSDVKDFYNEIAKNNEKITHEITRLKSENVDSLLEENKKVEEVKLGLEQAFQDSLKEAVNKILKNDIAKKFKIVIVDRGDNFTVTTETTQDDIFDFKIEDLTVSDLDKLNSMISEIYKQFAKLHEKRKELESIFKNLETFVYKSEDTLNVAKHKIENALGNENKIKAINANIDSLFFILRKSITMTLKMAKLSLDCHVIVGDEIKYLTTIPTSAFKTEK